jgi:hypothetical protein
MKNEKREMENERGRRFTFSVSYSSFFISSEGAGRVLARRHLLRYYHGVRRPPVLCTRDAYLAAGVVGAASERDAHHVALASVARADLIVSWNFKHIVHVDKIRMFNAVNLMQGYGLIDIRSPIEVV